MKLETLIKIKIETDFPIREDIIGTSKDVQPYKEAIDGP